MMMSIEVFDFDPVEEIIRIRRVVLHSNPVVLFT